MATATEAVKFFYPSGIIYFIEQKSLVLMIVYLENVALQNCIKPWILSFVFTESSIQIPGDDLFYVLLFLYIIFLFIFIFTLKTANIVATCFCREVIF